MESDKYNRSKFIEWQLLNALRHQKARISRELTIKVFGKSNMGITAKANKTYANP